jgi:hypothetical protein
MLNHEPGGGAKPPELAQHRPLGEIERGDNRHAQENEAEEYHFSLQSFDSELAVVQVGDVNIG